MVRGAPCGFRPRTRILSCCTRPRASKYLSSERSVSTTDDSSTNGTNGSMRKHSSASSRTCSATDAAVASFGLFWTTRVGIMRAHSGLGCGRIVPHYDLTSFLRTAQNSTALNASGSSRDIFALTISTSRPSKFFSKLSLVSSFNGTNQIVPSSDYAQLNKSLCIDPHGLAP